MTDSDFDPIPHLLKSAAASAEGLAAIQRALGPITEELKKVMHAQAGQVALMTALIGNLDERGFLTRQDIAATIRSLIAALPNAEQYMNPILILLEGETSPKSLFTVIRGGLDDTLV